MYASTSAGRVRLAARADTRSLSGIADQRLIDLYTAIYQAGGDFAAIREQLIALDVTGGTGDEYVIPQTTPVFHQNGYAACLPCAWCDTLETLRGLTDPGHNTELSRNFLYWQCRVLQGDTELDEGTEPQIAGYALLHGGVSAAEVCTYGVDMFVSPDLECFTIARDNRLSGLFRIEGTPADVVADVAIAVRSNHPVVLTTAVDQAFCDYTGGGQVWGPPPGRTLGRHGMSCHGVRERAGWVEYLLRNQWGPGWGDAGYCWVSEQYMGWGETRDLWVGTKMPGLRLGTRTPR
jgi:hypothetical protein